MEKPLQTHDVSLINSCYLHQFRVSTQIIYVSVLVAFFLLLSSLPFIAVDISVRGAGFLQPAIEKTELLIPVNGHINFINIGENKRVRAGDTVLTIDASLNEQQYRLLKLRVKDLQTMLSDVALISSVLQKNTRAARLKLFSSVYAASWQQFLYQTESSRIKKAQAEREFSRYEVLYKQKVISSAEFEKVEAAYQQSVADLQFLVRQYQSQWQTEASQYRTELNTLYGKLADWKDQQDYYVLRAPVSGSVQNLAGLTKGMNVYANQKVAEVSPDSTLTAVCFVSPSQIGLISRGQNARFMIDAFNYNQWGVVGGKVVDIGDDIVMTTDKQPVFKVKCKLNSTCLTLRNGYRGYLKKGMSFTARLMVTRRSLFQLLYDKADNWLNPTIG